MAVRPVASLVSILFLATAVLFQFFIILSGAVSGNPEDRIYFLQAATTGIQGAPRNPSRWTYFSICGVGDNGLNANCGAVVPALPFSPTARSNFGTSTGVPDAFVGTRSYYLLSRFAWVFYIIALFFGCMALLTSALALCTRLGAYLSSLTTFIALFWQTLAAALMTAWTVKARNAFRAANLDANLGRYAYGFTWASVAAFFISAVLFCVGGSGGRSSRVKGTSSRGGRAGFGRRKSARSRGSFIDSEHGVKDED